LTDATDVEVDHTRKMSEVVNSALAVLEAVQRQITVLHDLRLISPEQRDLQLETAQIGFNAMITWATVSLK
jgi:hypothetical protein